MKKKILLSQLTWLVLSFLFAQEQKYWSPEQVMKIKNITAVRVSPDGKKVVYAVREAFMTEDRSEYLNRLYLADANGKNAVSLTTGDKNNSNPKWSLDGKWIAFVSNRNGKNNLYIVSVNGGEPRQLSNASTGVMDFKWHPGGSAIAITMMDAPTEEEQKNKKGKNDWYYWGEDYKYGRLYILFLNEKDSLGNLKTRKLTKENRHVSDFDWSPDGKWIAYQHAASPRVDDNLFSDLAMVNITSGEIKKIAATDAGEWKPLFSPDGKWIAYISAMDGKDWDGTFKIKVVSVNAGNPVTLANTPDEFGDLLGWSADGQNLYIMDASHTKNKIFLVSRNGKDISEWSTNSKDQISIADLNDGGTHFGLVVENLTKPGDAYVSNATHLSPVKISNINPWINGLPIPKTEVINWKSFDGKEIEGLLTYPLYYTAGKKYPLILNIHGGPESVFLETFIATSTERYPITTFSENGFFILRPNPRGSKGYGPEFRRAVQRDWGGGDYQDIISGVDFTIAKGWVDSSKLAVTGWSYGGFMSRWIIGHTNRFKAACIGAPMVELVTQELTSELIGGLHYYMKKQPWEDWDVYNDHSPLHYVQNITTPVLLQHGEADPKIPFSQSIMFYNALKKRGVPVRFLALPRQPHGPAEPKMVLKKQQTNLEWIEHFLLGKPMFF